MLINIAGVLMALLGVAGAAPWGVDLTGRPVSQLAPAGTRAVVLFFTATDCPVANRYVPEITGLEQSRPGVAVWFVYPNPGDSPNLVAAHQARYQIHDKAILDTRQALTHLVHATVTPEAAILVPEQNGLREVYRGRIDDRYVGLGSERPQAMHHDLNDALDAVLAGQRVPAPSGPPVGCAIMPLARPAHGR